MKRVIIISLFLLFAGRLTSGVRLEGYYENTNTLDGNIRWYLAEPHHNIEFRFLGQPMGGVETFLKFHAESDKLFNNNLAQRYTLYDMVEAHARFRWEKGLEFVLFSRENRFWFPQGLMELVSQWTVNDNGNAQGVRADFWNIWKLHGLFIYSDYSQSGGEDATITRWSLPLLSDRFRLSSTFARKDWNGSSDNHNDVVSSDIYFSLGRTLSPLRHFGDFDCALELARSRIPDEDKDSKNTALKAEIRNLRVGPVEIKFAYREIGENFRSYLSSDYDQGQKYNESGYNINATYFFPTKAVNITTNYDRYLAPVSRGFPVSETNPAYIYQSWYNELYIEFIHDIRYKLYYRWYRGWDTNYDAYKFYPTLFNELSFENFLAKVRLQFRWKDIGTAYELQAFGFELNANLTHNWKLYTRAVNVNETSESRQTVFVQFQYNGWSNTDFFIEFGNPADSDNDLTNDDDFVNCSSSSEISQQVKTYIRVYF